MATVAQIMANAEAHTDLDVIAIADHDQVGGALEAVEWCAGRPGERLQAIVATEISMAWGRHLLALFFAPPYPTRPLPRFRSLRTTLQMVAEAGGIGVVPHPLSPLVPSLGEGTLNQHLAGSASCLHALEACSGVVGGRRAEARIRRLNHAAWGLALLGNSDAHHLCQIGSSYTCFSGRTPQELRAAIEARTTVARWGTPASVSLPSHLRQNWLSLFVKPVRELRAAARALAAPALPA